MVASAGPEPMQFVPLAAFRSGWSRSIPVSMTATFAALAERASVAVAAPMRRTPVGALSPGRRLAIASTRRSGVTNATSGSASSRST
jgi:hypothetical protein